jgi:alkylation response protein AidB-like acyl-CoA dehydrogenase
MTTRREGSLSEPEERGALRAAVAGIAASYGPGYFLERSAEGRFVHELWSDLAAGGFAGVNVAEEYGGADGTLADLAAVAEELARGGCPLMTLVVSPGLCAPLIERFGTPAQRRTWLAGIGAGDVRMSFAMTEAEAGSNTHRLRTRTRRDGTGWILHGEKTYISGVDEAAALMVVARNIDLTDPESGGFSLCIVETDRPGVVHRPIRMHVQAAERQSIVTFDDVHLTEADMVGDPGQGLKHLFHGLNAERLVAAATCIGLGAHCLEKAVAYSSGRQVWREPIGAHQAVAHPLAEAYVALESARLILVHALGLEAAGLPEGSASTMAKLTAADALRRAFDVALHVHGGNGLSQEYGLGHLWGLTRMYAVAPISREMTLNHIATHELGLPKSY